MLIDKEILDSAGADGTLINAKACGKVAVLSDSYLVEEVEGEILAIVVQEVVGWSLLPHVEDCHLAWRTESQRDENLAEDRGLPRSDAYQLQQGPGH